MKRNQTLFTLTLVLLMVGLIFSCKSALKKDSESYSGNPIFAGWYADPEGVVFDTTYWVYPTYSDAFEKQVYLDAFSSEDLVHWKKHRRILDTTRIKWAKQALWAPAAIEKDGKYFLFFGANDIQRPGRPSWDPENDINHFGGIGVAVADTPGGPFRDYLGKPLISEFHNNAQPIDQFVFKDTDGTYYFFYGGWSHCNLGILAPDFKSFIPWEDGTLFREITPEGYVEGPLLFLRNGIYYLMWSEGGWTNSSYQVAYATAEKPTGPFVRKGVILKQDDKIATGAGHNSVINTPGTDDWYIVYHRRPIPNKGRDHRVSCIDRLYFNEDGSIKPVEMTFRGVKANRIVGQK